MRTVYKLDLKGKVFGRWTVIDDPSINGRGECYWHCICECGTTRIVRAQSLVNGKSKSCGCLHKDTITTHGMTKTRTFKSWETMKQRCCNHNSPDYHNYGGRGVRVCKRWLDSFDNFLSDMGERPKGKSLDRIKNNLGYFPENCKWSDTSEQQRNKRNTRKVTYNDEQKTIYELADISGLPPKIIGDRLYAGWDIDRIMITPVRKKLHIS